MVTALLAIAATLLAAGGAMASLGGATYPAWGVRLLATAHLIAILATAAIVGALYLWGWWLERRNHRRIVDSQRGRLR